MRLLTNIFTFSMILIHRREFGMKRKSNFEKKYPLLADYIEDEVTRKNMLENNDLMRKYELFSSLISTFIAEITKRFDNDTVLSLIKDVVLKLPDELLESVIVSYLNSSEAVKSNAEFLNFYNKTLHLGVDSVHYIEKNGIICSRKYLNIPSIIIDDEYKRKRQGNETFKGQKIDDIFYTLPYESKRMLLDFIESSSLAILDLLFASSNISLSALLLVLRNAHITVDMFSSNLLNRLGADELRLLIYILLDMNYVDLSIFHIKTLVANNRIDLLRKLIDTREIYFIYELTFDEIDALTDEEILSRLDKSDINQLKKDE